MFRLTQFDALWWTSRKLKDCHDDSKVARRRKMFIETNEIPRRKEVSSPQSKLKPRGESVVRAKAWWVGRKAFLRHSDARWKLTDEEMKNHFLFVYYSASHLGEFLCMRFLDSAKERRKIRSGEKRQSHRFASRFICNFNFSSSHPTLSSAVTTTIKRSSLILSPPSSAILINHGALK